MRAVMFLGLVLLSSCALDERVLQPASEGAGEGLGWWATTSEDGCKSAGVPTLEDRPKPTSKSVIPPVYFAATSLRLGAQSLDGQPSESAWESYGFDLDGLCTKRDDECRSAAQEGRCKSKLVSPADGQLCRDNTFGRFNLYANGINDISLPFHLNDDFLNCGLCAGQFNLLFRISGYNGTPSDDSVRVDLYRSGGLETPLPYDCNQSDWKGQLCWLDTTPFLVDPSSMAAPAPGPDLPDSLDFTTDAYVRDGILVAFLKENTQVWFPNRPGGPRIIRLLVHQGLMVARLVKQKNDSWTLVDGTIAGRLVGDEIIANLRYAGLCEDNKFYSSLTAYVGANLDSSASPGASPEAPCDAISMGLRFEARQSIAGELAKGLEPLIDCP